MNAKQIYEHMQTLKTRKDMIAYLKSVRDSEPAEENRWIPVTERMPRYNRDVLTFTPHMAMPIVVGWFDGYYGEDDEEWHEGWYNGRAVTHWMPLPEPPKGE